MPNIPNDGREAGHSCEECNDGVLRFRKNSLTNGYFLGCDQFPKCEWACNPPPKSVLRERTTARRRAWYAVADDVKREQMWELEEERARASFFRDDEIPAEPYTLWDAFMDGRV